MAERPSISVGSRGPVNKEYQHIVNPGSKVEIDTVGNSAAWLTFWLRSQVMAIATDVIFVKNCINFRNRSTKLVRVREDLCSL